MRIRNNIAALNVYRNIQKNHSAVAKSLEKLSSGYAINRAGDDAAGLAISEKMRWQITGLDKARQNAQDGIGLVQTAEGALAEVHEMLNRMYALAEQSANGVYEDVTDRAQLQKELDQILGEVGRISRSTNFNGIPLLQGEGYAVSETPETPPAEAPAPSEPTYTPPTDVPALPGYEVVIDTQAGLPSWVDCGNAINTGHISDTYAPLETVQAWVAINNNQQRVEWSGQLTIEHAAAILDFTALDRGEGKLEDLFGKGFYSTCLTCQAHYTIRLTNSTENQVYKSGKHFVYSIGIAGVTSSKELVERIVAGTENGWPNGHWTKLAQAGDGVLAMYDYRAAEDDGDVTQRIWNAARDQVPGFSGVNTTIGLPLINGGYKVGNLQATNDKLGLFGLGVAVSPDDIPVWKDDPPGPGTGTHTPPASGGGAQRPSSAAYGDIILQIGPTADEIMRILRPNTELETLGLQGLSIATQEKALDSLEVIRDAIDMVSDDRGRMGSYQNRLEHAINYLAVSHENLQQAEASIRDTDMAQEMMHYTKESILLQAAQTVLAQANQTPQGVLQLLQ